GWSGYDETAEPYTSDQLTQERERYRSMDTDMGMERSRDIDVGEERQFDVVEEELEVGKREIETGGVRVRSYVTSRPVEEQIRLRSERVRVDRRPVDRPAGAGDIDAFQEGEIEVTERHEEPVVSKSA